MPDRLITMLEPTVQGLGYELLGIERNRSRHAQLLRLYIDQASGISVDDCERVSRQVSDLLDVEQAIGGEYTLEVSSPGIERPLFTLAQHRRFIGERIAVRLRHLFEGRRRLLGQLAAVTDEGIVVAIDDDRITVPFGLIERSKLAPEWPLKSPRGKRAANG